jgi:hypothetical protein
MELNIMENKIFAGTIYVDDRHPLTGTEVYLQQTLKAETLPKSWGCILRCRGWELNPCQSGDVTRTQNY